MRLCSTFIKKKVQLCDHYSAHHIQWWLITLLCLHAPVSDLRKCSHLHCIGRNKNDIVGARLQSFLPETWPDWSKSYNIEKHDCHEEETTRDTVHNESSGAVGEDVVRHVLVTSSSTQYSQHQQSFFPVFALFVKECRRRISFYFISFFFYFYFF